MDAAGPGNAGGKGDYPVTRGVRFLRERTIAFEGFLYAYKEHGGTAHAAEQLGIPEHAVIKTLVFESELKRPFLVLMHGDREVSQKELARILHVKSVRPCDSASVERITGYVPGGVSPFGTRSPMPVYIETTVFSLPRVYLNGGKRGFLVALDPQVLRPALHPQEVYVAILPVP